MITINYNNPRHMDALRRAASHFLSEVPETDGGLKDLILALEESEDGDPPPQGYLPWEAVEDYPGYKVAELIRNLAEDLIRPAGDPPRAAGLKNRRYALPLAFIVGILAGAALTSPGGADFGALLGVLAVIALMVFVYRVTFPPAAADGSLLNVSLPPVVRSNVEDLKEDLGARNDRELVIVAFSYLASCVGSIPGARERLRDIVRNLRNLG